jgi:hypothetical protein
MWPPFAIRRVVHRSLDEKSSYVEEFLEWAIDDVRNQVIPGWYKPSTVSMSCILSDASPHGKIRPDKLVNDGYEEYINRSARKRHPV